MDPNTGEVAAPTEAELLRAKVLELERERELKKIATARVTRSETQGKLALALSKAQGAMENAAKDANNPFYGSKYADLASVWGAIRKPLSDNELAIFHTVLECSSQKVSVETRLHHSSDEWCATVVSLPITAISKDREKAVVVTAQHIGAALTYGRRYGIQLVTGNAPRDDDDGNLISGKTSGAGVTREQFSQEAPPTDDAPPPSSPPAATKSASTEKTPEPAGASDADKLEAEIPAATDPAQLKVMVTRISSLPESERKVAIRKLWNAKTKELKAVPPKADPGLAAPVFAGESATDRAARGAAEAAARAAKTEPNPETMTEAERIAAEPPATREPGEEG